mmetsp:Transcript_10705/g.28640  ORF Transcript_10705/g.28640 Transcript_10705/m.28640 type:complete len:275 (+) Transcript_10705:562-1386(+)
MEGRMAFERLSHALLLTYRSVQRLLLQVLGHNAAVSRDTESGNAHRQAHMCLQALLAIQHLHHAQHSAVAMPALSQFDQEPRLEQHGPCDRELVLGAHVLHGRCHDTIPHSAAANGLCISRNCLRQSMLLLFSAVLQQVLYRVVAEAVASESDTFLHQSLCERADLRHAALLQQLLHDAAAIAVPCNRSRKAITLQEFINHELQGRRGHKADALLENVVCVRVAHRLDRTAVELLQHGLLHLIRGVIQGILHPSSSFRVLGKQPDAPQNGTLAV